ncbi:MAG TPA: M15 family metallopeptidase [Patescibacteria group bacterium]|nr:M15 family metallopeptidase [Patescibacteria group bacterium]
MPSYSQKSLSLLDTCHPDLQRLFREVIKTEDCKILCGHRGKEAQEEAFRNGRSKARWGESNHNYEPSCAVDVMPYPVDWADKNKIVDFADFVKETAHKLGIGIRWGGDFKGFFDGPHYELTNCQHCKIPE